MARCLVQELTSLINLSGIKTVTSVYFGGGGCCSSVCIYVRATLELHFVMKFPVLDIVKIAHSNVLCVNHE